MGRARREVRRFRPSFKRRAVVWQRAEHRGLLSAQRALRRASPLSGRATKHERPCWDHRGRGRDLGRRARWGGPLAGPLNAARGRRGPGGACAAEAASLGSAQGRALQWTWTCGEQCQGALRSTSRYVRSSCFQSHSAPSDRTSHGPLVSCARPLPFPNRSIQEGRVPVLEGASESKATGRSRYGVSPVCHTGTSVCSRQRSLTDDGHSRTSARKPNAALCAHWHGSSAESKPAKARHPQEQRSPAARQDSTAQQPT